MPLEGLIPVMTSGTVTVKTGLETVPREFDTAIAPVCAPTGTVTINCVADAL